MVLTPSTATQTLSFIPSVEVTDGQACIVRLNRSGDDRNVDVSSTVNNMNEWVETSAILNVVEGSAYDLMILINNEIVYKDVIFATTQEAESYQTITDVEVHETENNYLLPANE